LNQRGILIAKIPPKESSQSYDRDMQQKTPQTNKGKLTVNCK